MPTTQVGDWPIFYLEFGDAGLPPLVLLHGLYGNAASVAPLAELLSDRFRVIAPDALGHGQSAAPDGYTLADQGQMVDELIASFGYESAAVVGISMGSYLAAQAAILEPSRVSRLVLIVGKAHGTTSSSAAYAKRMGFDLANATPEAMLEFMAGAIWSKDTSPERRAEILGAVPMQDQPTAEERAAVERSLAGFDLRPDLGKITAPTLVISGRDDGLNPPESGKELADGIRGSRFEVYQHSGHMLSMEESDRLVDDITHFVVGSSA
jgi:pimeloyl-ACP methyl ester carboxylesterase